MLSGTAGIVTGGRQTIASDRRARQDHPHPARQRDLAGRCRYRDRDGVTRIVQRVGPPDDYDQYGKLAVDALKEALADATSARLGRHRAEHSGDLRWSMSTLCGLPKTAELPDTLDTYRFAATKLQKFIGGRTRRRGDARPTRRRPAVDAHRARRDDALASPRRSFAARCSWR